ncbi:MAG: TetR/AcrR family transcriptional regulator, partial [Evtepia sp.]
NYFPSKADLIADTVMTIWHDIFHNSASDPPLDSFVDCVVWFFNCVTNAAYTHFFSTHSLHFAHAETAKKRMEESFFHMKAGFLKALEDDPRVSPTAFSEEFTRVAFVDFVFSSLLSLLMKQESSCGVLLEIISRTIY